MSVPKIKESLRTENLQMGRESRQSEEAAVKTAFEKEWSETSLVVQLDKTQHFQGKEHRFDPWSRTKVTHATQCSQKKEKFKIKKKKEKEMI